MNNPAYICAQFQLPGKVIAIEPWGNGNINDTFVVHLAVEPAKRCILQRINNQVFPRPELIMENIRRLTDHMRRQLEAENISPADWRLLELYSTGNGADFFRADSSVWRMLSFIEKAECHEKIKDQNHAHETGRGLGLFHRLVSNLDPTAMHDTLPGFHRTPQYLKIYDSRIKSGPKTGPEIKFCRKFIDQRRSLAQVLEKAGQYIPQRIIHGDPRINNIMIDKQSGRVVCLIDLDTVKSGLIHYDIGDCLRSCCNQAGEEAVDPEKVSFDLDLCRIILQGYFSEAEKFITPGEYNYIFSAINLIPFELGVRFFNDFLADNIYFKTRDPEHNLRRAMGQFYLTRSIEKKEKQIRGIITEIKG